MKIIENEQIICCDVDETLISWDTSSTSTQFTGITDPYTGKELALRIHEPHIYLLKMRLARGATVILWSAGGYKWAKTVAEALGLTHERLICMSKPVAYIDDKSPNEWMGEHIYLPFDSNYGKS